MKNESIKIALGVALIASAMIWVFERRKKSSSSDTPTLLTSNNALYMDTQHNPLLPLGYRNNNPTNIRVPKYGSNNWKGKTTPATEKQHEHFCDMVHGYRAALVLLRGDGYINKGINTIRKIITKWAPPEDKNHTANYIADVSKITGIDPDAVIKRTDKDALSKIVYAMSICENGTKDYAEPANDIKETYGLPSWEMIEEAWKII